MNYHVVWSRELADRLHTFLFIASELGRETDSLALAVAEINARLSRDPAHEGESRDDAERVLIVHPISVTYEVFEAAGVVMIYTAVVYPKRRV